MKAIGPTFGDELRTAGVADGVSWQRNGEIVFSETVTEAQRTAVIDVYNAHDPNRATSVPQLVTMRQARLALLQNGMLTQVNTAVANMPGAAGDAARIEWEFSSAVERNHPLVQSLIGALGLTESQLDDLFRLAATL